MTPRCRDVLWVLAIGLPAGMPAYAQYPAKPLRLIVPFPPGGGTDTLARIYGYASSGSGTSAHLAAELFSMMAGVKMTHIPYKGGGPAVIALTGGQVSIGFATTPSVIGHIKSGKMRGLAVTTARRSPSTPDLPTISESGLAGYEAGTWYGALVPTGTSKDIVARLNSESLKVLKMGDVKDRLDTAGFETIGTTPEQFGSYIRSEIDKWGKVVRAAGVKVE